MNIPRELWRQMMPLATLALLLSTACGGTSPTTSSAGGAPIKVGILLPQSGNSATIGKRMTNSAAAAFKEVNDAGGVSGRKIDFTIYDTVGDPKAGIDQFQKMTSVDGTTIGLIGFSNVVTAIAPFENQNNKVVLFNGGAPPFDPTKLGANTIHTLNGQDNEMAAGAKYAYQVIGSRNAGFIYADIAANSAGVHKFADAFQALGGKVAGFEAVTQGQPDFRSVLTRLRGKQVDLVYVYTYGPDDGNIMKQIKELGMSVKVMGYSGIVVPETISVGAGASEGLYATSGFLDTSATDTVTQKFLQSWKKYVDASQDPKAMTFYDATMYDSAKVLVAALEKVIKDGGDVYDPAAVIKAIHTIKTFPGVTGIGTFGTGNVITRPFMVVQVQNGAWATLGKTN
jgi:branched-chain amino acid transport system substrate-binding protein